jgi:hypothetical protein
MAMTPEVTNTLEEFARRMMGSQRASDDERFAACIIACHRSRAEVSVAEIGAWLETSAIGARFDAEQLISRYTSLYAAGRDLLARYDAQRADGMS